MAVGIFESNANSNFHVSSPHTRWTLGNVANQDKGDFEYKQNLWPQQLGFRQQ